MNQAEPIFSNGLEHYSWLMHNCDRCRKQPADWYQRTDDDCRIFRAISANACGEPMPEEIAAKIGRECAEFDALSAQEYYLGLPDMPQEWPEGMRR